ncbi:MAG TPA: hypothetical protein VKU93_05355 [Terracidiphilus sp.]|jgi:hypothetical protein|nr:hypothetical protein [Terracidiphilus sp.]
MELTLNLAWAAVAAWMLWAWARYAPREETPGRVSRRTQMVALGLVILILLPAISMTDDLTAARNPAEIETCIKRDHDWLRPHVLIPAAATAAVPLFAGPSLGPGELIASSAPAAATSDPALHPIESRPPPAA